jgi:glycogen(starch) synthase
LWRPARTILDFPHPEPVEGRTVVLQRRCLPGMKILLSSYAFAPSVGGIEEVSELVATEFAALGHSVRVVTMTPSADRDAYPFAVIRHPGAAALLDSVRWCDAYLQMHVSLKLAWPLLLYRRPWIVSVHMPLADEAGMRNFAKRLVLRFARVTTIAEAIQRGLGPTTKIVPNPYRSDIFQVATGQERSNDLIFVGRLVSVKGVALLLEALALLRERGIAPRLMIVGGGPEEEALRAQCASLGLDEQVKFAGLVRHEQLPRLLNQSRIMVLPSFLEGFPIVVLEAIACGCAVVGSDANGLPEAIGPCGLTFPKGDAKALADRLAELLSDDKKRARFTALGREHLARHQARAVAEAYLAVINDAGGRASRT